MELPSSHLVSRGDVGCHVAVPHGGAPRAAEEEATTVHHGGIGSCGQEHGCLSQNHIGFLGFNPSGSSPATALGLGSGDGTFTIGGRTS